MKNFLSSPVYHVLCSIFDLVVLNLCYLLCCFPIVTIGSATAALHAAVFGLRQEDGTPLRDYFRYFRRSLGRGIPLWILWLAGVCIACADFMIIASYWGFSGKYVLLGILALVLVLLLLWGSCLFATLSFASSLKSAAAFAFRSGFRHLPRMIPVCIVNLIPVWLVLCWPYGFTILSAFFILIWFALTAYVNTIFLHPILENARTQE